MNLLPPDGARTICEDRCALVNKDNAADVSGYSKLVPGVLLSHDLPPELLPQHTAVYPPPAASGGGGDGGDDASPSATSPSAPFGPLLDRLTSHLHAAVAPLGPALLAPLGMLWSTFLSGCSPRPRAAPVDWHPTQPWMAAADARGRVQVVDLGPALRPARNGAAGGAARPEVLRSGEAGATRAVLAHEVLQPQALCLAWCPTSPGLLAVGTAGALCLWAVAGEARPPLAGRSAGPWLRHLRTRVPGARVTSVSWSPDGRLLAAASPGQAGLQVWEVSSGIATPVSAGPAAFDTVRWSPCGSYVFAAGTGSRHFYVFETQRWRWARWQLPPGGSVVAAAWAPPSPSRPPLLLAALSNAAHLVALHLVDAPPGLTAQLLPVGLPGLGAGGGAARPGAGEELAGRSGPSVQPPRFGAGAAAGAAAAQQQQAASAAGGSGAGGATCGVIADMAWDPRGERLAVLLAPPHPQAGRCLALYATTSDPVVSASLLGYARPPDSLLVGSSGGGDSGGGGDGEGGAAGGQAAAGGAALSVLPGGLVAACVLAPAAAGGGSPAGGPSCVVSVRVGCSGVYTLPCYS